MVGDKVKVHQYDKKGVVVYCFSPKEGSHSDVRVKLEDGEVVELSFGAFERIDQ